jgi:hypothetical protein
MNKPQLNPDFFLTAVARQLADNYRRWPRKLVGSRVFFEVEDEVRTLAFMKKKPRLFAGYQVPDGKEYPYLRITLSRKQLAEFFTGRLDLDDPANDNVIFEGNSEALYHAVGECLG